MAARAGDSLESRRMPSFQQSITEAQRFFQAGQYAPARDAAKAALRARRDHPGALHVLGAAQARLGQVTEARRHLRKALRACRNWQEEGLNLGISVNLSARDLRNTNLGIELREMLRASGVRPHLLTLEITEEALVEDVDRARQWMHRAFGI